MKYLYKIICALIIAIVLFSGLSYPGPSSSLDARIADFLVTQNTKDVLVYFTVRNCFTKKIEEAVLAGIPTSFTFLIEMYRERPIWNSTLSSLEIRHTIKYDNVRNTFYVSYSEQGGVPVEFRDLESAKRAMADLNGVPIASLSAIKKEIPYVIKAKAKLAKVRMPLKMEYVFFFVSLWDFETDWFKQGFIYK